MEEEVSFSLRKQMEKSANEILTYIESLEEQAHSLAFVPSAYGDNILMLELARKSFVEQEITAKKIPVSARKFFNDYLSKKVSFTQVYFIIANLCYSYRRAQCEYFSALMDTHAELLKEESAKDTD